MNNASSRFSVNTTDLAKTARGLGITALSAALVYLSDVYASLDYTVCLGSQCFNTAFIAIPLVGALLELGRRFVTDYKGK